MLHLIQDLITKMQPAWNGWMRCSIKPYLIDNKVIDEDNFVEELIYTIEDYAEYLDCFNHRNKYNSVINKSHLLLLENMQSHNFDD